jgi:tetratricopeptide (TPR) repeat protein
LNPNSRDVNNDSARPDPPAPLRRSWPCWAGLAAAVFMAFLPALRCQFVNWDDDANFLDNPHYRGLSPAHLKWMFTTFLLGHYQPLSWITLGADYVVWGMNPLGYHLTSLLLHALGVCVFFEVLRALFRVVPALGEIDEGRQRRSAFIGALLFGLHPLRVESVVWITERRDVLCGVFFLLSVLMYLRMHEQGSRGQPWAKAYGLSLFFFACSLFSKALGIALPAVLLVLDVWPLGRFAPGRRAAALVQKLPFLLVALLDGIIMLFAMRHIEAVRQFRHYEFADRALQAAYGLCFYVGKTVVPLGLAPFYPVEGAAGPTRFAYLASLLGVLGVTALVVVRRRRWPALLTGWVSYGLLVSPVLGLVVTGRQVTADRYTYLACLPFAALLAGGVARLRPAPAARAIPALAALLVVLGILTLRQAGFWKDGLTLWSQQVRIFPAHAEGLYYHGLSLEAQKDYVGALRDYDRALELDADLPEAYFSRGFVRAEQGDWSGAISDYTRHLKWLPTSGKALYNRGLAFMSLGNTAAARADFTETLALNPTRVEAWVNRANLEADAGDLDKAAGDYDRALEIAPTLEAALFNRGNLQLRRGNAAAAIADYSRALEGARDPKVFVQRGNAELSLGRPERALEDYGEAIRLDPKSFTARVNRAGLFASRGDWKKAADDYEAALRLAPPGWEPRDTVRKLLEECRGKR